MPYQNSFVLQPHATLILLIACNAQQASMKTSADCARVRADPFGFDNDANTYWHLSGKIHRSVVNRNDCCSGVMVILDDCWMFREAPGDDSSEEEATSDEDDDEDEDDSEEENVNKEKKTNQNGTSKKNESKQAQEEDNRWSVVSFLRWLSVHMFALFLIVTT